MKLNRRKAMAAIVGGASTAPQIVRSTMENKHILPSPATQMNYSENSIYDPIGHAQRLAKAKEYCTRIANGDFSGSWEGVHIDDCIKTYTLTAREIHIDSFKSLSSSSKERIKHEKHLQHLRKTWMEDAKEKLLDLLNKKPGDIF